MHYTLHMHYRAWKEKNRIYSELRVGEIDDGIAIDGKARELLKAVYLKPLRDAEREMSAGRSSRISQILLSHPIFQNKNEHRLIQIFNTANDEIERYLQKMKKVRQSFKRLETTLRRLMITKHHMTPEF